MVLFLLTAMTATTISTLTHLLHSKSTYVHYKACLIDYIGVNMYIFGSGIITFYSFSDKTGYHLFGSLYLPLLTIATWLNFSTFCLAKVTFGEHNCKMKKNIILGTTTTYAVIFSSPFSMRLWNCYRSAECSMESQGHVILSATLLLISAFFYISHIPERLLPGKCDIVGHGHQLFHVTGTMTQLMQIKAVREDFSTGALAHTEPNFVNLLIATFILLILKMCTMLYIEKKLSNYYRPRESAGLSWYGLTICSRVSACLLLHKNNMSSF